MQENIRTQRETTTRKRVPHITPHALWIGFLEAQAQKKDLFAHIAVKGIKQRSEDTTDDISEEDAFRELLAIGKVPQGYFHNAGSADYYPQEKRFQTVRTDPFMKGAEIDVIYYPDVLMAAHGHGFFLKEALKRPSLFTTSRLKNIVSKIPETVTRINFDLKLATQESTNMFIKILDQVPENTQVTISGKNWKMLKHIIDTHPSHKRKLTVLFTVDGVNETRDRFSGFIDTVKDPHGHRLGVSLSKDLAKGVWKSENDGTPLSFMEYVKRKGLYTLLYCIDSREELVEATQMNADGITSNKPDVLRFIEKAQKMLDAA